MADSAFVSVLSLLLMGFVLVFLVLQVYLMLLAIKALRIYLRKHEDKREL